MSVSRAADVMSWPADVMSWPADVMSWPADVMKPGFQRARTHSKPGFMSSWRTRGAQIAVLAVPA